MGKLAVLGLLVLLAGSTAAEVEVGQGVELFQYEQDARVNFTQENNFSAVGAWSATSFLETSNFTAMPENSLAIDMDFYSPGAGRQDFVTNFSASGTSQQVEFNLSDLPDTEFYEAFETGTDNRIKIGYTDPEGNFNFSESFSTKDITVLNYGEKGIEVNEITFNDTDPVEGSPVRVSVNLSNEGVVDSEAPNTTLDAETYDGSSWVQESFRDQDFTVGAGSYVLADFTWVAKPGPWNFRVVADPGDDIKETDESNNRNSTILNVSSYKVFYGGTDLKLELGADSANVKSWKPAVSQGNVFFADADSDFYFSNLEPVGANNFTDVDEQLNLTGHNDSVSEVWDPDSDGAAESTKEYSISGQNLTVPVANSTSDGTWKTGILYDTMDGKPYSGSEDLVFVTEIQDSAEGKHGIYDYEIRVPFSLRSVESGVDRVNIYTEIK